MARGYEKPGKPDFYHGRQKREKRAIFAFRAGKAEKSGELGAFPQ